MVVQGRIQIFGLYEWSHYDNSNEDLTMNKFEDNLKRVKVQ